MKTYRTLKGGGGPGRGKFIYKGQRFRAGEVVESELEPTDGKGNSLVDCDNPAFEFVSEDTPGRPSDTKKPSPSVDFIRMANDDPRTKPQIAKEIELKHGVKIDSRQIRKVDLLAQEYQLDITRGKDATQAEQPGIGTNDAMTGLQAQEFVK